MADIAKELRRAINRGMEGAGTLPAKEAVKVRPADWHAIIDKASAAIDALDAAHKRIAELSGGWQPIESAPKDGTDLIGYRPDQGVFAFRWAWMEEFVPKDQNGDPTEDYDDSFACWWHDRWGWMERELTPTCWQPLPAPPTPIAQKEKAE